MFFYAFLLHFESIFVYCFYSNSLFCVLDAICVMSLICETIASDEELSHGKTDEDELDFDEEVREADTGVNATEERTEEELDEDDDLEEGEVKEDDEEEGEDKAEAVKEAGGRSTSICRFYGRGQCTWGNNCRFVHPSGTLVNPINPQINHVSNQPIKRPPPPPPRRPARDFYSAVNAVNAGVEGGVGGGPGVGGGESAWERGLKQAKEMIVRSARRKEQETDFEDKRFHLGVEEESEINAGNDGREDEYERRRRLAFESAPWNNDEPTQGAPPPGPPQRRKDPEQFRDPWRRSTTPPVAGNCPPIRRRPEQQRPKQRSDSMSSISGSDSGSEFSGSSSEFSESTEGSGRSGGRRRYRKTEGEKKPKRGLREAKPRPENTEKFTENWAKTQTDVRDDDYDSWSESLSESEDSSASFCSESDASGEARIPKRADGHPPPPKRAKVQTQRPDGPKKSPIKMTFMKKHPNLKKDIGATVAQKLNGGREVSPEGPIPDDDRISTKTASPLASEPTSPPPPRDSKSLMATVSRREELLQQLKAVEDAIARKRSKIN
ncbi:zinc finger CCCH domain-containing protein 18-like isoform X2 [Oppia nitens]|uniref:zinc finger CCCH domain-containing protein 18-like isoform X2 n=1 Tax=Oppia nitens TaxID=1686743 RepID=UPI0023DA265E|nr:zinc finger CCCH domain-containing protein 18-like isoform X2 [Oppia nitens]